MSCRVDTVVGISHYEMKIFLLRSIPVFRVTFLQPALGLSPIWKARSGQRQTLYLQSNLLLAGCQSPQKSHCKEIPECPLVLTQPPESSLSCPSTSQRPRAQYLQHPKTSPIPKNNANAQPPLHLNPRFVRRRSHKLAFELGPTHNLISALTTKLNMGRQPRYQ